MVQPGQELRMGHVEKTFADFLVRTAAVPAICLSVCQKSVRMLAHRVEGFALEGWVLELTLYG